MSSPLLCGQVLHEWASSRALHCAVVEAVTEVVHPSFGAPPVEDGTPTRSDCELDRRDVVVSSEWLRTPAVGTYLTRVGFRCPGWDVVRPQWRISRSRPNPSGGQELDQDPVENPTRVSSTCSFVPSNSPWWAVMSVMACVRSRHPCGLVCTHRQLSVRNPRLQDGGGAAEELTVPDPEGGSLICGADGSEGRGEVGGRSPRPSIEGRRWCAVAARRTPRDEASGHAGAHQGAGGRR
jgi:hypothetical protein